MNDHLVNELGPEDLALFDFDGTITTKDSFFEFIRFARGNVAFYYGLLILSPVLVLFKLKLIRNWQAKERVLSYFFKGVTQKQFNQWGQLFCAQVIPGIVRPRAKELISRYRKAGVRMVLVSASAENWLSIWAKEQGFEVLATQLEVKNDRITGKLAGKNCHGPQKEVRIRQHLDLNQYVRIVAFGDSKGDREMLRLATKGYFKYFE